MKGKSMLRVNYRFSAWILLSLSLILASCSDDQRVPDTADQRVPDTADGTVKSVLAGVNNNQPDILWEAIPASYQKDVNGLVHELANNMDATLYNKTLSVAGKVVKVMKEKKTFILNSPMMAAIPPEQQEAKAEMEKSWDDTVKAFGILLSSDLGNIESMKKMDMGKFLSTTGAKMMKAQTKVQGLPIDLTNIKVELLDAKADTANLKITMTAADCEKLQEPVCEPKDVAMKKVEGKWLPAEMVETWTQQIGEIKASIAEIDKEKIAKQKPQIMLGISVIEGVIDQIASTTTQEEFNTAVGGLMGMMMGPGVN
jgi:hypothetical protein